MNENNSNHKVYPWTFLNPNTEYVPEKIQNFRYKICTSCELFNTAIKTCRACGCFMHLKTKLANASCPINKWDVYSNESGDM
jgi:hypothetical protein